MEPTHKSLVYPVWYPSKLKSVNIRDMVLKPTISIPISIWYSSKQTVKNNHAHSHSLWATTCQIINNNNRIIAWGYQYNEPTAVTNNHAQSHSLWTTTLEIISNNNMFIAWGYQHDDISYSFLSSYQHASHNDTITSRHACIHK